MSIRNIKFAAVMFSFTIATSAAHANVIFSENFESYAAETDLIGQGGWFRHAGQGTGPLIIRQGAGLGSLVADGHTWPGSASQVTAQHALSVGPNTTRLSLNSDAYAFPTSSGVRSHNFNIYLTDASESVVYGWTYAALSDPNCSGGYHFNGNTLGAPSPAKCFNATSALDMPVSLETIIDLTTSSVQGNIYQNNTLVFQTAVFSVAPALIQGLDHISMRTEYRGEFDYTGGEVDNIVVRAESVELPEPSSLVMFCIGLIGLRFTRRRA